MIAHRSIQGSLCQCSTRSPARLRCAFQRTSVSSKHTEHASRCARAVDARTGREIYRRASDMAQRRRWRWKIRHHADYRGALRAIRGHPWDVLFLPYRPIQKPRGSSHTDSCIPAGSRFPISDGRPRDSYQSRPFHIQSVPAHPGSRPPCPPDPPSSGYRSP